MHTNTDNIPEEPSEKSGAYFTTYLNQVKPAVSANTKQKRTSIQKENVENEGFVQSA